MNAESTMRAIAEEWNVKSVSLVVPLLIEGESCELVWTEKHGVQLHAGQRVIVPKTPAAVDNLFRFAIHAGK